MNYLPRLFAVLLRQLDDLGALVPLHIVQMDLK